MGRHRNSAIFCALLAIGAMIPSRANCQTSHNQQQQQHLEIRQDSDEQQKKLQQLSSQQEQQNEPTRMDDIVNQLWDTSNALDLQEDASKLNARQENNNNDLGLLAGKGPTLGASKLGALVEAPFNSTSEQDADDMKKIIGLLLDHHSNQTASLENIDSQQEQVSNNAKISSSNNSSARASSNASGQTIARSLNQSTGSSGNQMYPRAPYAGNYDSGGSKVGGAAQSGQLYTTFLDKMNKILSLKQQQQQEQQQTSNDNNKATMSDRIDYIPPGNQEQRDHEQASTISNKSTSNEMGASKAQSEQTIAQQKEEAIVNKHAQINNNNKSDNNNNHNKSNANPNPADSDQNATQKSKIEPINITNYNKNNHFFSNNEQLRESATAATSASQLNKYAAQLTNDLSPTPAAGHPSEASKSQQLISENNNNYIYQEGQSFNNLLSPPSQYGAAAAELNESATLSSMSVPLSYYNQEDASNKLKQYGLSNMLAAAATNNSNVVNYYSNPKSKQQANLEHQINSKSSFSNTNTIGNSNVKTSVSQVKTAQPATMNSSNNNNIWQHQQRLQNGTQKTLINNGAQPPHYAASLINLTAPMILPLSASESMEADALRLGADKRQRVPLSSHLDGLPSPSPLMNAVDNLQEPLEWSFPQQLHGGVNLLESGRSDLSERPAITNLFPSATSSSTSSSGSTPTSSDSGSTSSEAHNMSGKSHNAIRLHLIQNAAASGFRAPPSHTVAPMRVPPSPPASHHQAMQANSQFFANPYANQQQHHEIGNLYANGSNIVGSSSSSSEPAWLTTSAPASLATPSSITRVSSLLSQQLGQPASNFALGDMTGGATTASLGDSPDEPSSPMQVMQQNGSGPNGLSKQRVSFNLTRVEHISAECSNDLIRTVIIFNGTFKGIIYSSGYVGEPSCLYVNGTGKTRYEFSIRLNQCGTHQLATPKMRTPTNKDDVRRREQVMFNTLSIQYNPIIEQEWDEHFRVSCEYGTDFWKTISFNPFKVETNTGAPVAFTAQPPACQMEVRKGHNMVGPRQEAISGPVTVGDPLTLLIHMKSEKAGYDILVKNCVAHNGGHQKMALIDANGCVVNERFISPFRGTFNDNDLKQVTLYAYLKAFRFTGSPVLYLECEIHMCQSACPPQMCYWRRLSKRSTPENEILQEFETNYGDEHSAASYHKVSFNMTQSARSGRSLAHKPLAPTKNQMSDSVNLSQSLEVRQDHDTEPALASAASQAPKREHDYEHDHSDHEDLMQQVNLLCYRRSELLAYLLTIVAIFLVAIGLTVGCCLRATSRLRKAARFEYQPHRPIRACKWQASVGSGIGTGNTHSARRGPIQLLPWFCGKQTPLGSANSTCLEQPATKLVRAPTNNIPKRLQTNHHKQEQFYANQATNNNYHHSLSNNSDYNGY